jgi:hypothetical protein
MKLLIAFHQNIEVLVVDGLFLQDGGNFILKGS